MIEDLLISGFGVIGTEVLYQIVKKNKKNKLNITVLEKDYSNFPGGVAYSSSNSKFGFFNNPLRLSNYDFQKWVGKLENQKKLIQYFKSNKDLNLGKWLKKNIVIKLNKFRNINELYLPRLSYSIFLKEKFIKTLKMLETKKFIKVNFFENELIKVSKIKNEGKYICSVNKNLEKKKIIIKNNELIIVNSGKKKRKIFKTNKIILGLGILPPSNINKKNPFKDKNYIHDFYATGATNNLLKKIKRKLNSKKILVVFIGNKAGLLETVQEIENLDKMILKKLKIITISPSLLSLEKAELSEKYSKYKFKYLLNKKISKIKKSYEILSLIKSEFKNGIKLNFNKYDVWTLILKNNLLDKCFKRLSLEEKKIYNNEIFTKLRNLTRYTYPEAVDAKNRLERKKILHNLNDKVHNLSKAKDKILVKTVKTKNILADVVINVSGPVSLLKNYKEVSCLNSLKKLCLNFNERGFISDKHHRINENIYAPGTLSSNFNPERRTIIKSITENCKITAVHFIKTNN